MIVWYRARSEDERQRLFGGADVSQHPDKDHPGIPASDQGKAAVAGQGTPMERLLAFAHAHNLHVTATTGGGHNPGSLHFLGRAIDVSTRDLAEQAIESLKEFAAAAGIHVLDERKRLPGEAVWTGPHLHLSFPLVINGREKY